MCVSRRRMGKQGRGISGIYYESPWSGGPENIKANCHHIIKQQNGVTLYVCLEKNMLPGMLPRRAIPFLKGLGMLTPNPWKIDPKSMEKF